MTRAQLVTILYRAAGSPDAALDNPFTNVPREKYFAKAVAWAAGKGIIDGYPDSTFKPDDKITREQITRVQIAVIIMRFLEG